MTEIPTTEEFGDLVGTYEDELRASIECAVNGSYYRKSDLTDAADAILDALDARAERIAELEAQFSEINNENARLIGSVDALEDEVLSLEEELQKYDDLNGGT
jgi:DNA repair exonuclease SbcCD ATPase subunit